MTTTTTTIQPPKPLDLTKLHTPAEWQQWKAEVAAYHAAIRAGEERKRLKAEAAKAEANKFLSPEEYFALALERQAEKEAREAEREAARQAEQEAKAAYLASLPDIAEVSERSEFLFLQAVIHWAGKGYTLSDDGIVAFLPGFYACRLNKPATFKKAR